MVSFVKLFLSILETKNLPLFWHFMVLFPLKTWNRLINVVVLKQNQKASVTSKVYFVFIYISDSYFTIRFKKLSQISGDYWRSWYRCYVCNAWLTLVNHLHFKIYPYTYMPILCICLGFFSVLKSHERYRCINCVSFAEQK